MKILTADNKKEEKFLREKTADVDFEKIASKELGVIVKKMKSAMIEADGVGLAANQIGLNMNMFVARTYHNEGHGKFYAAINPVIEKTGGEKLLLKEGCLSVPGKRGVVERFEKLTLKGFDKSGKPLKIKAWGLLAHVFQHEVDHLNGILYTDKAKELYKIESIK